MIRTLVLVVVAAASGAVAPAFAQQPDAAAAPDLAISASFFTRYELRAGFDDLGLAGRRLGEGDGVAYRARIGLATTPIDVGSGREVILRFVPQASGFWGDVSGGLTDAGLGVHEGVLRIRGSRYWVDTGRFEMAYGTHLVIGDVGWHETGRAFDGVRGRLEIDDGWVDAFATAVAEGGATGLDEPVGAGDQYFSGVYAGLGPLLAPDLDLDAYALALVTPKTSDPMVPPEDFTAFEITIGSRLRRRLGRVDASVETGGQLGKRAANGARVTAFQIDLVALADVTGGLKLGGGALWASGDDPDTARDESYNQLFPTAHKFLGMMDIMGGRSNVASVSAKARYPLGSVALAADGHLFWRPEVAAGVDHYTGFESDLWALYKLGAGLGLRAQYSLFVPGAGGPLVGEDPAHYVEVQLAYKR